MEETNFLYSNLLNIYTNAPHLHRKMINSSKPPLPPLSPPEVPLWIFFFSLLALIARFQTGCAVMRCMESKLDNEDAVQWCKKWRRLRKKAIYAYHHFVAAHADYCHSLRITGSALPEFAVGETFYVLDQTCRLPHEPMVLLRFSQMTIKIQVHCTLLIF